MAACPSNSSYAMHGIEPPKAPYQLETRLIVTILSAWVPKSLSLEYDTITIRCDSFLFNGKHLHFTQNMTVIGKYCIRVIDSYNCYLI